ncbi:MAG: cell division ATP-binding protein FtsE [Cyanobacteria bacterium P01_D01_bin.156]
MTSTVTSQKARSSRRQTATARRANRRGSVNAAVATEHSSSSKNQNTSSQSSSAAAPLVTLTDVTKTYENGSKALRNVDLKVKQGDFLFITGPSGAGKSTLLKLLYGQERVTSGEISVDNQNLSKLRGNRLAMLRRRIGIVFQDYKLIPRRTVAENVSFVLWAQGFNRREINRRLRPTLRMVGLQHKSNCFPDQLSGGEQQRVSIARAVVGTPPLLLADEPTGNLDSDNSRQVIKILEKLNSIGITVIVTTHDEQLVRTSNHPVVQIQGGRLTYIRR